jgi:hypothetical protein
MGVGTSISASVCEVQGAWSGPARRGNSMSRRERRIGASQCSTWNIDLYRAHLTRLDLKSPPGRPEHRELRLRRLQRRHHKLKRL